MSSLDTLDIISNSTMDNADQILEYSPYSSDVKIIKLKDTVDTEVFGYETPEIEKEYTSRGFIIFSPEKRWLKKVGIYTEKDLPIIALLKHSDSLKKKDIVKQIIKDTVNGQVVEIERDFEIVDVISYGSYQNIRKAYHLSPYRGRTDKLNKPDKKRID
ncbi:MAG: hypothetical protein ABSG25_12255 [Bryobacteraceae bacterium]